MTEARTALIVDDERDIRELLVLTLGRMGLRISTAANLAEAREQLAVHRYDLCITDMRLPDGNGIELVHEIARNHPSTPVAMITAFGSMDLAVEALKAGAFDFVSKPVDLGVLRGLVRHALELGNPADTPGTAPASADNGPRLLGDSCRCRNCAAPSPRFPAARPRCTSWVNPVSARSWSHAPSTSRARAPKARSCR
jgi:Response regulator containing CheY-like receiver, AAA-type ATPase, and DNA-binding domains